MTRISRILEQRRWGLLIFPDPTRIPFPVTEWRQKAAHCASCGCGNGIDPSSGGATERPITNYQRSSEVRGMTGKGMKTKQTDCRPGSRPQNQITFHVSLITVSFSGCSQSAQIRAIRVKNAPDLVHQFEPGIGMTASRGMVMLRTHARISFFMILTRGLRLPTLVL
jgi:hypothetical protein